MIVYSAGHGSLGGDVAELVAAHLHVNIARIDVVVTFLQPHSGSVV